MGVESITVILAQKHTLIKFLLHIADPLSPLWLMASKRTICNISLTGFLWLCLIFSLLSIGCQGTIYFVTGTNVTLMYVGRNVCTDCNVYINYKEK